MLHSPPLQFQASFYPSPSSGISLPWAFIVWLPPTFLRDLPSLYPSSLGPLPSSLHPTGTVNSRKRGGREAGKQPVFCPPTSPHAWVHYSSPVPHPPRPYANRLAPFLRLRVLPTHSQAPFLDLQPECPQTPMPLALPAAWRLAASVFEDTVDISS